MLGYVQLRPGPQKTGFKGALQPIADAVKLFTKESTLVASSLQWGFLAPPSLLLASMITISLAVPAPFTGGNISLSVVYTMAVLRVGVYFVFGAGVLSSSKYSTLGGLRAVAQTISYEVGFFLVLLSVLVAVRTFDLSRVAYSLPLWLFASSPPLALLWFVSSLAETRRAPFDFREGESELVSGFNTEYRAGPFALFFIGEYGFIIIIRALFVVLFIGGGGSPLSLLWKLRVVLTLFVWVRGSVPRVRYDVLIDLAWKALLPLSLGYLALWWGISAATS